jgi:hypothetical protein
MDEKAGKKGDSKSKEEKKDPITGPSKQQKIPEAPKLQIIGSIPQLEFIF